MGKVSEQKYRGKIERFEDYAANYVAIPAKVIRALGGKFRLRLVCSLNGQAGFQCGLMALGDGRGFVMLSKKRLGELGLETGQAVSVSLKPDTSKYGMKMPAEFKEVLKQDPEAKQRFDALSDGKKRTLLFRVGSVKSVDKRIEAALKLLENLKMLPRGKETIPEIFGKRAHPGSGRW